MIRIILLEKDIKKVGDSFQTLPNTSTYGLMGESVDGYYLSYCAGISMWFQNQRLYELFENQLYPSNCSLWILCSVDYGQVIHIGMIVQMETMNTNEILCSLYL